MLTIYTAFILIIAAVIAIGIGLELSSGIDEFVIFILFWMLYIITIITFINIFLVVNYYLNMKNKTGPVGIPGPPGERGDKGEVGICDPGCRDVICETQIGDLILDELKKKITKGEVKLNNVYIKSKIRQMCASDEFKQLAPVNGPQNLINYVKNIWLIWLDLLYNSGGIKYFETIGAESEFEWLASNPFDELKKYDVFYWGMGKQYRPEVSEKCYSSRDGNTPDNGDNFVLRTSTTNYYELLGTDEGSGAYYSVSFWRAKQFTYQGNVFYPVGDVAIGPKRDQDSIASNKTVGQFQISELTSCPERQTIIVSGDVKGPVDYILIWSNYNNNNNNNNNVFWVWRPIPPAEFMALGDVVTFDSGKPESGDNAPIRCVPLYITKKITPNGNIFWSSLGSIHQTNLLLLGYIPNDGETVNANSSNAYNLFRAVIGTSANIPASDVNANFYSLDTAKFDSQYIIGGNNSEPSSNLYSESSLSSNPDTKSEANLVGKGYLPTYRKDSQYSILSYINLKNNPILTHYVTKTKFEGTLIPNAISNAYLIKTNDKCVNYDNENGVTYSGCDEELDNQIFSIIATGNKKNECRIQHYNSKKYIKYKNGMVILIDENDKNEREHTLFMMK
jgi:hypothetical protein